ncbi:hypothetical protein FJZ40_01165 [Candidatus Shapirobacteria bacterium]|nr:hypothetical protein [Chloroflexota bacterium]MBM3208891.1 hypothetical protein [Candidatus Shapirobacteria bacterium]
MEQTITTNLRLPYTDWLQIKTLAAEAGMSTNEYLKLLIQGLNNVRTLTSGWLKPQKGTLTIWDLPKLAKKKDKPLGVSAEDKLIYG